MSMQLTKNFTLEEMTVTNTGLPNVPNKMHITNMIMLATMLLQPVRDLYGNPMHINSGFRSPEVNKAVNGSSTSGHMKGQAADVRTPDPRQLFNLVRNSGLSFDQLILYPTFVHMSFRSPSANRKQVLYAKGVKP